MLKRLFVVVCLLALVQPVIPARAMQDAKPEIPAGTELQLTLRDPLSSKLSEPGDEVLATVRRDVVVEGRTIIKQGTEIIGRVTLAEAAKRPFKGGRLHITFERMRLDGQEHKLTAVIKSASDFTRDEKVKSDGEGTLQGGGSGGNVLKNVGTAAAIGSIGVTIAILSGIRNDGRGGGLFGGGISQGAAVTGASILGASVITGVLMTKGNEVRLDEKAVIRLKLERPISIS
ncbi:MAG TPA: hypothetical protein PLD20_26520 [Blastocatellia bacterium]|nr:hypothetical protein [Blastocatellia bacterium]HMX27383.1 hypothetical protein [Blastocatellia bacterium]HMZ21516.1 hypothetical protein [Blastocatellia bacterium]HNG32160.1 hypothetical protein [Blastocatellia bacterium]